MSSNYKHLIQKTYSADDKGSFAIPATTLDFGILCLRNALALIEHCEKQMQNGVSTDKARAKDIDVDFTMSPSRGLTQSTFLQLKYATLSAYCYVQIHLSEYILALKHGQELVSLPNLPDTYK